MCRSWTAQVALIVLSGLSQAGCKDSVKVSLEQAELHVAFLSKTIEEDVQEVRTGLPQGADVLGAKWKALPGLGSDLKVVHYELDATRGKVQDLRIAKSTFFALADVNGTVLRNDQEQDQMAGKNLFGPFPALAEAKDHYVETTGSMPEASGVRAPRPDGQWVAAAPVRVDGTTRGLYVTGWSWASYAYHLEFALRSKVRAELAKESNPHEPLVYVFMIVGKAVYGAPVTPEVDATTIAGLDPLPKAKGTGTFTARLGITGRDYGVAVQRTPLLGADVGVAVLRSET